MNLSAIRKRIETLEAKKNAKAFKLPDMIVRFIEPVQGEDGLMRPGPCTGSVRMAFGSPPQWLDADGNPIPSPAHSA